MADSPRLRGEGLVLLAQQIELPPLDCARASSGSMLSTGDPLGTQDRRLSASPAGRRRRNSRSRRWGSSRCSAARSRAGRRSRSPGRRRLHEPRLGACPVTRPVCRSSSAGRAAGSRRPSIYDASSAVREVREQIADPQPAFAALSEFPGAARTTPARARLCESFETACRR